MNKNLVQKLIDYFREKLLDDERNEEDLSLLEELKEEKEEAVDVESIGTLGIDEVKVELIYKDVKYSGCLTEVK